MAKTDNLTDFLTGVANAIRTKKGTTAKINPQNFEAEIDSIMTSKPEQEKTVKATNSQQEISPDDGKTLSRVIVEAAPLPDTYNSKYKNINECLIDKTDKILILGCNNSTIPSDSSVTSIGSYAFQKCRSLTSIVIPGNITIIGEGAFQGCRGLTSVTIGNGVTSISNDAFDECSGLTNITIPDSVTSIGGSAFTDCSGIESLVVTAGNKKYHSANNCIIETETKKLIIGCKTSVIPSDGSVTSIGSSAFFNCSGLTNITIPDGVTSIDSYAFRGCGGLTNIIIPDSVTYIAINTFGFCGSLTSVTIGNGITSLGAGAFQGCSNLAKVTMFPTTPPKLEIAVFEDTVINTITVPVGCGEAYKTATGWSAYADKIVEATA